MIILIDKRIYLRSMYNYLFETLDITDERPSNDLLYEVCQSIEYSSVNWEYVNELVYSDLWIQGHREPIENDTLNNLFDYLIFTGYEIIHYISKRLNNVSKSITYEYTDSDLSLAFRVE